MMSKLIRYILIGLGIVIFALLLTVAEELQAEGRELIDVDPEILKSVVNEVLREGIGGLVKSSLTESLKHVTGNVE